MLLYHYFYVVLIYSCIGMMMMMMMMMFPLSTPAYPLGLGLLCGYKTNILSPLPAEVYKVSITVQINAGSLEGATSGSSAPAVSLFLSLKIDFSSSAVLVTLICLGIWGTWPASQPRALHKYCRFLCAWRLCQDALYIQASTSFLLCLPRLFYPQSLSLSAVPTAVQENILNSLTSLPAFTAPVLDPGNFVDIGAKSLDRDLGDIHIWPDSHFLMRHCNGVGG